jgi:mevalonate kinase
MNRSSSACGKFILLGEHSILYGGPALVYPVPEIRLHFSLSDSAPGPQVNGKFLERWQSEKLKALFASMNIEVDVGRSLIETEIPIGKGLGSSAALSVAVARYFFPEASPVAIAKLAINGEAVFHGASSGVDPFGISLEQPLLFRRENQEFRPLQIRSNSGYVFVLRDSGVEHSTSEVLQKVASLKENQPVHFQSLIERLKVNTNLGLKMLENNEMERLGLLLQDSNRLLFELGLGNEMIQQALESLLREGALGAKLTGAGLGGYVIGLFPDNRVPKNLRSGDLIVQCSGS